MALSARCAGLFLLSFLLYSVSLAAVIPDGNPLVPTPAPAPAVDQTFLQDASAGGERPLERVAHLADTPPLDPQPALDASAALLRDGEPASGEQLSGMVAVDTMVVTHGEASHSKRDEDRKVSNIKPKKKPMWSDSILSGAVQVLIYLVDRLEEKEMKSNPPAMTTTPEPMSSTTPEETHNSDQQMSSVITIVQVIPPAQPPQGGLIIELAPPGGSSNSSNSSNPSNSSKAIITVVKKTVPAEDHVEITRSSMQRDVPIVSEETVPMMVNMVPSEVPEMVMVQEDFGNDTKSSGGDASGTDLYYPETHKYVYYPTQFFSEEWNVRPGSDAGFLGYKEHTGGKVNDDDSDELTRVTVDDIVDVPDFESLKDDAFLVSETTDESRGDSSNLKKKKFKPSKQLIKIAKLRFALSSEAKQQNFKKFQGYSDRVLALLQQSSALTGREQLGVLLAEVLTRAEIKTAKTLRLAKAVLEELERADSDLSKALEGIPALSYATD